MFRRSFCLWITGSLVCLWLLGCRGVEGPAGPVGPAGAPGPMGPVGPAGADATASQTYVGSDKCGQCHEAELARFNLSGHPQIMSKVEGDQPPAFTHDDVTGGVPQPPAGYEWNDISYVIGGYRWKALFVDQNGYLITGQAEETTQYNLANPDLDSDAAWVSYHPGETVIMDCGQCHTTGFRAQGHQDNKEGLVGTWAFAGIQCEACHGAGSGHAADPYGVRLVVDRSPQLCGHCHQQGSLVQMQAHDGFTVGGQEFTELYNSKHFALDCITCHDPHASSQYADANLNPTQGIRQTCENCHWQNETQKVRKHLGVDCIDCHMPPMGRFAQANPDLWQGDVRSHQFAINTDPNAPQFSDDGASVAPYLTLQYACQHCHNGEYAAAQDIATLAEAAQGYHLPPTPTPEPTPEPAATPAPTATP